MTNGPKAKPAANDTRHSFVALMERAEAACRTAGDLAGALEARLARVGIEALLTEIETELGAGTSPALLLAALPEASGRTVAAAVVALTHTGKAREGIDLLLPILTDTARNLAAVQDRRALEHASHGRRPT